MHVPAFITSKIKTWYQNIQNKQKLKELFITLYTFNVIFNILSILEPSLSVA